jgi:hypothetical protein
MVGEYYDEEEEFDPIEGYCMRCRESVDIENAKPVWTRKGLPATRGECSICGGTVFRMGKTHQHDEKNRPDAVTIGDDNKRNRPKLARDTVYVTYDDGDEEIAQQIASDLEKVGIAVWLHEHGSDETNWASGVHPALLECARMVYVMSAEALTNEAVISAWTYYREKRKPIVIAQIQAVDPPDPIRRSPRFDFIADYKRSFREMLDVLS